VLEKVGFAFSTDLPSNHWLREVGLQNEAYRGVSPEAAAPLCLIDIILEAVVRGLARTALY
jgi:hypothetical protein